MTRFARRQRFLVGARFAVVVVDVVAKFFGISTETLRGHDRHQATCRARMICIFLLRGATGMSYPEIGKLFDYRDHATISYALKTVETWLVRDPDLRYDLLEIASAVAARTRPSQLPAQALPLRMLQDRQPEPEEATPAQSPPQHAG